MGEGIFKALSEKNKQPRILYPARLSFRIDGEISIFQDHQSLTNFVTMKAARAKKFLMYQGKGIRITSDLSIQTWIERKGCGGHF